jgi:hypothetical protein
VADEPGSNGVVSVDQRKSVKLLSAVIGTSAVVVMGAVAVAVVNEQAGTDSVRAGTEAPVTTTTTPPTAPPTSVATPATTASTPAGYR